jgi:cell division inhibitor SepF
MWRKAMVYLGLGEDGEYDPDPGAGREYPDEPDRGAAREQRPVVRPQQPVGPPAATYADEPSGIGTVRPISSNARSGESRDPGDLGGGQVGQPRPRPQVVRPMPVSANAKPFVVVPASFNAAQEVADKYKGSQPVIMNLQGLDRELSRRLIDFASGLCYGLGGQMERVANQVYLLTPTNVEVSAEERRRLHERGYDS